MSGWVKGNSDPTGPLHVDRKCFDVPRLLVDKSLDSRIDERRMTEMAEAACKPGSVPNRNRAMAIPLGCGLPRTSRDLPERPARKRARISNRGPDTVVPTWSCSRWGLPCRLHRWTRGALLPHPFTLTRSRLPGPAGGLLSVALSLGSPPPGVTRHRVPVEPGLSSLAVARESSHPATSANVHVELCICLYKPFTATNLPIVSWSRRPSTRHGRKRRWNAARRSGDRAGG
jgi:hypothetical protein